MTPCGCYWQARSGLDLVVLTMRVSVGACLEQSVKQKKCGRKSNERIGNVPEGAAFAPPHENSPLGCFRGKFKSSHLALKKIPMRCSRAANGARTIIVWLWRTFRPGRWNP